MRAARPDPGLVIVGLLVLLAVSPLFQPGLPNVADAPIHLFRTAEWVRAWRAGIWLPRWSPTLAYGYGLPLFVFAPPLPYALAGGLHLAGVDLETAIKLLSIGCLAIAGIGMYLLVRSYFGSAAGVAAAAAYLFAPFLLREAHLYGGNYPQLLAISLFPPVLWAFHRLVETGRTRYLLLATGSYGALLLSHNFHALVFSPLLASYVLGEALFLKPRRFGWRIVRAGLALVLGLAWTAFFWLPAFIERQWTRAQADVYVAVSPFYLRFLDLRDLIAPPEALDRTAANPDVPFTLGPVILALAGLGVLAVLVRRKGRWPGLFFSLVLLLVVWMLLPASEWLWANVPLLAVAEFPWRLMGIAALCCAFLVGAGMTLWPPGKWTEAVPAVATLCIILGSAVYLYPPKPFVGYGPAGTPSLADQVRYERATGTIGSTTLGEYLSVWVEEIPRTSPLVRDLLAGRAVEKLDRSTLPSGVEAELLAQGPNLDRYRFSATQPFSAHFFTFYFPGWRATMDGQPAALNISKPLGLIEIPIPAGQHEVTLRFGETPLRRAANLLSLVSLAVIAGVVIVYHRRVSAPEPRRERPKSLSRTQFLILLVGLLVLFLGKQLLVDPHTSWFRQESPPGEVSGASHPAEVNLDDKVRFLGYDLDRDVVRAGQRVRLTLYWQALEPLQEDYNVFVHLDAPPQGTTMLAADNDPPGDAQAQMDIPTTHWEPESYVRDEHRFVVPVDLPAVRYALLVGLYAPTTGADLGEPILLQELQVLPADPIHPSQVPNRGQFRLGDQIELLGYEVEEAPTPTLTLYWRADGPVTDDYVVFVHVLDGKGQWQDQRDGPPLGGTYPTSAWWPGQIIADRREMPPLPANGQFLVGLYDLASMQRLPAYDGDGRRLPDDAVSLAIEP